MLLFGSWMAYVAEHPANPGFATFGDALWWGIVTLTTVGYGDIVPETTKGRTAAVFLMLTGIATLGIISGTLASAFRRSAAETAAAEAASANTTGDDLRSEVVRLRHQYAAIEQHLAVLAAAGSQGSPSPPEPPPAPSPPAP